MALIKCYTKSGLALEQMKKEKRIKLKTLLINSRKKQQVNYLRIIY